MRLIRAALRLPAKAIAVAWTLVWQSLCSHPAWSNPTLIGGFGRPIARRRCLHCGYDEATWLRAGGQLPRSGVGG